MIVLLITMFKIILITPETNHPEEEVILQTLVETYNEITVHVRKPSFDEKEYEKYLSRCTKILPHMVLHEHHWLANILPVNGVHLKENDRKAGLKIDKNVSIVSTSLHAIIDAKDLTPTFEYVFYGPLMESISKERYGKNVDDHTLRTIRMDLHDATTLPVIGIGGVDEKTIVRIKDSGFDGAALLGAVWMSKDPVGVVARCQSLVSRQ